ncbi:MAG: glycosyl transferase family protein [Microgenomates group bacterium Gr01-1014_5]|nr:MAG: glycosyl transferase family protein [Microgenomates group bacterium Gr01-1014_5]
MKQLSISVVIPNWQGRVLLEKNLPRVLAIGADEVIVVENGSTDGSLEYLKKQVTSNKKQELKVIENERNLGFARGVNQGFKVASGDVVILLNTDVVPDKGVLIHVLPHFENPDVFAVSFNEGQWSWAKGFMSLGLVEHVPGKKVELTRDSFWASGGSAAFSREKWLELGGFNLIYEPFYWEDVDLSYRAQKRGWKVLWEPKAQVEHKHEITVGKHSLGNKKDMVAQRNQVLFFWCNITSTSMWAQHLIYMPLRLIHPGYWIPFLWAILKLPQVFVSRSKYTGGKVSDEEILAKFKS